MAMRILTNWIRYRSERAELDGMHSGELDRFARDIGLSPRELEQLVDQGHDAEDAGSR